MNGQLKPEAIARAISWSDRKALLALDDEQWGKVPSESATTNLLFGYAIPLIAVRGDWAKRSRVGALVCQHLEPAS